nr:hypothetical protein GCM10020241_46780 [Streptoalloteichus tenebrarius]
MGLGQIVPVRTRRDNDDQRPTQVEHRLGKQGVGTVSEAAHTNQATFRVTAQRVPQRHTNEASGVVGQQAVPTNGKPDHGVSRS